MQLAYAVQPEPEGLARVFALGEAFLDGGPGALVLGDTLVHGQGMGAQLRRFRDLEGAAGFGCWVKDPSAYGVVEIAADGGVLSLEQKPHRPRSNFAVAGLYFYDATVMERVQSLQPSARGELEIADLNRSYLEDGMLQVEVLGRATAWLGTATFEDLAASGDFIRTLQQRHGLLIGSPEEAAWRQGYLGDEELRARAEPLLTSGYGRILLDMLERECADRPV